MTIDDILRIRKNDIEALNKKTNSLLSNYVINNSKFNIGDIVIDPQGNIGSVEGRKLSLLSIQNNNFDITYKINILTKKLSPRKDGKFMHWREQSLVLYKR